MTYKKFIENMKGTDVKIKLSDGNVITLSEWESNLKALKVLNRKMKQCGFTLLFP